jgi:hypothetical protein
MGNFFLYRKKLELMNLTMKQPKILDCKKKFYVQTSLQDEKILYLYLKKICLKEQLLTRTRNIGRLTTCCDNYSAFICDLNRLINVSGCVLIINNININETTTQIRKVLFDIFNRSMSSRVNSNSSKS